MKCPLLIIEDIRWHDNQLTDTSDCLEEECAWWIKDLQRCCVLDTALCLNILNDHLSDLVEEMPLAGEFTK